MISSITFVDHNTLKATGWWPDVFSSWFRSIPIYCEKCKCQRMHDRSDVPFIMQLIYDGTEWKDSVIGVYFECVYCKENKI